MEPNNKTISTNYNFLSCILLALLFLVLIGCSGGGGSGSGSGLGAGFDGVEGLVFSLLFLMHLS